MTVMLTMMMTTTADDALKVNRDRYPNNLRDMTVGMELEDNEASERKDRPTSSVEEQFPSP